MEPNTTDSVGPSLTKPSRSLDDLCPEILILIFEELYNTEGSDGCKPVRLVSRALCAAAVPCFYRDINFKPRNPSKPFSLPFRSHLDVSFENTYTYARNARVDVKMNWVAVAAFLMKCRQLERLDWAYWENAGRRSPIPTPIQDFLRTKSPRVRLYVWCCSIPGTRTPAANVQSLEQVSHIASIPNSNLVGLSMHMSMSRGRKLHEVAVELLTTSPHLESIELLCIDSNFCGNKTLPPIKHLSLSSCSWTYTADGVSQPWDFSRLETLRLVDGTHTLGFLQSVSSKQLPCLKRLEIEGSRHIEHKSFTELLGQFLLETPQLLEISLICRLWSLSILSIARHSSLRILSLKDHCWVSGRGEVVGTIAIPDIALLQTACKHLAELTLDVRDCDIFPTLTAISKFRNLRRVTLRVPTRLLQNGEHNKTLDIDYHSAYQMAEFLSSRKEGVSMEKLSVDVGYYNSQSGAYTAEWATQRAKGHIPERLFIFTWNEAKQVCFEEIKGKQEGLRSIADLGLAKWLKVHKFPPN